MYDFVGVLLVYTLFSAVILFQLIADFIDFLSLSPFLPSSLSLKILNLSLQLQSILIMDKHTGIPNMAFALTRKEISLALSGDFFEGISRFLFFSFVIGVIFLLPSRLSLCLLCYENEHNVLIYVRLCFWMLHY